MDSKGGGTAILIHKRYQFKIIESPSNLETIETTSINMKLADGRDLILVAIYAPKQKNSTFSAELSTLFTELGLESPNKLYLIAGDFNAKHIDWSNNINNERDSLLRGWLDSNELAYRIQLHHTASPSFPRGNSYIDLILSDARIQFLNTIDDKLHTIPFNSDYVAVVTDIHIPILRSTRRVTK
ncbi:hypothetical protein ANTRET_LOCUS5168 [Anthophora retusa]